MPKARYLAPWHQEDVWEMLATGEQFGSDGENAGATDGDRLAVEALRDLKGKPAIYHCISRVVDRRFVFGDLEKEQFVSYMRLYERFCQVRVLAFCVMSNHFHLLLEVPAPPADHGASWSDEELLAHLRCLYTGAKHREIAWQLDHFRAQGNHHAAEELRASFFTRMWDLSQFMKTLKQRFTRWFNKQHQRKGTLWEERFKSTLVESGLAARTVAGYIDLNPVRAGIIPSAEDYRWSSLGEAVAGQKRAREGLQRVMFERERHATNDEQAAEMLLNWRKTMRRYREILGADLRRGEVEAEDAMADTRALSETELLRKRVRYFTDGLVIGTRQFVDNTWAVTRGHFGARRRSGARKLHPAHRELRSMRDLRVRPEG